MTVGQVVAALGGECIGSSSQPVLGIAPLGSAGAQDISFVTGAKYASQLAATQAGCVIVPPSLRDAAADRTAIIAPDPYLYYARLTQWWVRQTRTVPPAGVHGTAVVDASSALDPTATVGAFAVIEAGAVVGAHAVIGAHAVVGEGARVGAYTRLSAHVQLGAGCSVGERCVIHGGVVIGADGFGFAPGPAGWEKIEQLGAVRIGNDVEIGANTCIDRGALDDTVIEDGVKLDNLIQIAHNVHIGRNSAMAACVGVAGSARIGSGCTVGGGAGILGHLELADGVHVSSFTLVSRSIRKPGVYSGVFPFDDNASWEKNAATLRQLHALRDRLRALEKTKP